MDESKYTDDASEFNVTERKMFWRIFMLDESADGKVYRDEDEGQNIRVIERVLQAEGFGLC